MLLKREKKDDLIICAELSRLGRNLFMIMEIFNICMTKEYRVWTIKDSYRLGEDIQSKVLAFAFGLSAEIERNLIKLSTKEALAKKRVDEVRLGRPMGSRTALEKHKLFGKMELMSNGISQIQVVRICGVSKNTLVRFIDRYMEYPDVKATSGYFNGSILSFMSKIEITYIPVCLFLQ